MQYGVNLPLSSPLGSPEGIATAAREAERLGFSTLWVGDHVALPTSSRFPYPYSDDGSFEMDVTTPWLDPLLTLAWAAAATTEIRIGTAVLVLAMRPVVLVAKQLASLDLLADGRLVVGAGAGWFAEEFELLGQSFERRGAQLDRAIDVLRACWAPGIVNLDGLGEFAFEPKPAQGDRVPILIGGASDAALRRVVRRGDGWLPAYMPPDALAERLAVLDRLLAEERRTRDGLELVVQVDAEQLDLNELRRYEDLGVTHVFAEIAWRGTTVERALERMAEVADVGGLSASRR